MIELSPFSERLARFERSVEAVERTTSGVMLDSLNAFSVMVGQSSDLFSDLGKLTCKSIANRI